jgi:hypothetical protein
MRLESQYRRSFAEALRAFHRGGYDGTVAAVHPVEIAHSEHGAAKRRIGRMVAHDEEVFRRHGAGMLIKLAP